MKLHLLFVTAIFLCLCAPARGGLDESPDGRGAAASDRFETRAGAVAHAPGTHATDEPAARRRFQSSYTTGGFQIFLARHACRAGILLLALLTGAGAWWRDRLARRLRGRLSLRAAYAMGLIILIGVINLAFDFWYYWHARSAGVDRRGVGSWFRSFAAEEAGIYLILLVALPCAHLLLTLLREPWRRRWWVVALACASITFGAHSTLSSLFDAPTDPPTPIRDERLAAELGDYVRRYGLPADALYQADLGGRGGGSAVNAHATLVGGAPAIVYGEALLRECTPEEIKQVTEHEIGHLISDRNVLLHVAVVILLLAAACWTFQRVCRWAARRLPRRAGFSDVTDPVGLLVGALFACLCLFAYQPIKHTMRRAEERSADRFAALQTIRDEESRQKAVRVMRKLSAMSSADPRPHPVVEFFLYTHPPADERVDFFRNFRVSGGD